MKQQQAPHGGGYTKKFYDRDGNEITQAKWVGLRNIIAYRVVRVTPTPAGKYSVATHWIGGDVSFGLRPDRPLYFYTVVKRNKPSNFLKSLMYNRGVVDAEMARLYSGSEQEALEDHERMLREWAERE